MVFLVLVMLFLSGGEVCFWVDVFAGWFDVELAGGLKLDEILVEAVALTDIDLAGVGDAATGGEDVFMACGCDLLHRFVVSMERESRRGETVLRYVGSGGRWRRGSCRWESRSRIADG